MKTLLLLIFLILSGCYTQYAKITPDLTNEIPSGEPSYTSTEHFFIMGIAPSYVEHDALEGCKNHGGIAFVGTELSFSNQLLSAITLGIYSPSTTIVYCNENIKNLSNNTNEK